MPSRAERRRAIERAWRLLALVLLAWAIAAAFRGPAPETVHVTSRVLMVEAPRLARAPLPPRVDAELDAAPSAIETDQLSAIERAGGTVTWRAARALSPVALEVSSRVDPAGGARALIAAEPGARASLYDRASPLFDTVAIGDAPAMVMLAAFSPPLSVNVRQEGAAAAPADSFALRRVIVLAHAGWEGKFLVAALEERGWHVSAAFDVAPGLAVTQGAPLILDTARTLAVFALDSASAQAHAAAIGAFVRSGGGAILAGDAANAPALAELAPGRAGARERPATVAFVDSAPRRALGFRAIAPLARDAIPIEVRGGSVAVAARRVGAGRVVQVGYDETWRWRFEGSAHSLEADRAWWSGVLAGVACRAATPIDSPVNEFSAPLAHLVAALGPPASEAAPASIAPRGLPWWLLAVILAAFLAEIASRRLRGAP